MKKKSSAVIWHIQSDSLVLQGLRSFRSTTSSLPASSPPTSSPPFAPSLVRPQPVRPQGSPPTRFAPSQFRSTQYQFAPNQFAPKWKSFHPKYRPVRFLGGELVVGWNDRKPWRTRLSLYIWQHYWFFFHPLVGLANFKVQLLWMQSVAYPSLHYISQYIYKLAWPTNW